MHRMRPPVVMLMLMLFAAPLCAAEKPLDFVHALQEAGYGDTAVEYLQMLEKNNQVPPELNAVWDLELSQSYQAGARNAFDDKEAKDFSEKAALYLAKFLKENPTHPEAGKAVMAAAIQAEQKGLDALRAAKLSPNKEEAASKLAEAKAAFEAARPNFQQALERFKERLATLKPGAKGYDPAMAEVLEGQMQLGVLDVYIARSIADPKDAGRVKMLKAASTAFDAIYQKNRENVLGLAAHLWQGKAEEELGNIDRALDIYEEVLAYGPDPATAAPQAAVDPIFAEVEYAHLVILQKLILEKKKKPAELLTEAKEWLEAFKKNRKNLALNYFQGVAFEYVKACDIAAVKAVAAEKRTLLNDAGTWLNIVKSSRSEFQREAIDYWRKRAKGPAEEQQEPKTSDEAFMLGQSMLELGNTEQAFKLFETALSLAPKNIDAARLGEIKAMLNRTRFNVARDFYVKEKYAECLNEAEKIAQDPAAGDVAPVAASMSVQAAYALYLKATENDAKDKALERMHKNAAHLIATWPGRPEADDARMTVGKADLVLGKLDDAINTFKTINIKSDKFPIGMFLAGHTYWNRYLAEKQKPENERKPDQMTADRTGALDLIAKSLEFQKKGLDASKPLPKAVLDAQILLAEIAMESNDANQAVQYLQPLIDGYLAHKPDAFDMTVLRVFTSAVKAYSAKNDLTKAGEVGLTMIQLGPDTPQVNRVLMDFTKLLDLERKKAAAEVTTNDSPGSRKKLDDTRKMLGEILAKLKDRAQLSPADQVFIADAFASINDNDNATKQYEKLLGKIDQTKDAIERQAAGETAFNKNEDPSAEQIEEFRKSDAELKRDVETGQALAKAKTRIQSQIAGLKRKKGDYPGALAAARALVKDNPNALEPRLEECRILQAQAEISQNPKDFAEASAGWSNLRQRLEGIKPRPTEYYEVLYNAANCLVVEAEKSKSKDKEAAAATALKAEKVLNAALFNNRNLSGPDMVAQYNALIKKAAALQGRNTNEKKP